METIYLNPYNLVEQQEKAMPSVMALGFFDGVHIGHRKVIEKASKIAKVENLPLVVMSFFPHPKTVLSNGKQRVDYLMPLSEKRQVVESLGVDKFYIVEFDRGFASLTPEQFVQEYLVDIGVVHAVAGFDYSYGSRGAGHMGRLNEDSGGFLQVTKVGEIACEGEKISSTCIREKIQAGQLDEIPQLLGRHYKVEGVWEEDWIRVNPYYLLPAPGRYKAVVCSASGVRGIELLVTEEAERVFLPEMEKWCIHPGETVAITWHHLLSKELFRSYYPHGLVGIVG